jgi:hypothetical protein
MMSSCGQKRGAVDTPACSIETTHLDATFAGAEKTPSVAGHDSARSQRLASAKNSVRLASVVPPPAQEANRAQCQEPEG